jgi:hypothetical protein
MHPIAAIQLISPANSSIISTKLKKKSTSDGLNEILEKNLRDYQPTLKRAIDMGEIKRHID